MLTHAYSISGLRASTTWSLRASAAVMAGVVIAVAAVFCMLEVKGSVPYVVGVLGAAATLVERHRGRGFIETMAAAVLWLVMTGTAFALDSHSLPGLMALVQCGQMVMSFTAGLAASLLFVPLARLIYHSPALTGIGLFVTAVATSYAKVSLRAWLLDSYPVLANLVDLAASLLVATACAAVSVIVVIPVFAWLGRTESGQSLLQPGDGQDSSSQTKASIAEMRDTLLAIATFDCYTRPGEEDPQLAMMRMAREVIEAEGKSVTPHH